MTSDRSREQSRSSPAFLEGLKQRPSQHWGVIPHALCVFARQLKT